MPAVVVFRKALNRTGILLLSVAGATAAQGVTPEDYGVKPVTATLYLNPPAETGPPLNHNATESIGVAITDDGSAVIGWQDDDPAGSTSVSSHEAVWALFSRDGARLTSEGSLQSAAGEQITADFRAFFRHDGSAVPGNAAWGPKIKANLFGPGFGMGASGNTIGREIPALESINLQDGDGDDVRGGFPVVQLLDRAGAPLAVLSGVSDADAQPEGDIRIADWEYLSNGNIVIAGESRQKEDLADRFGGEKPDEHAVFRIVNPQTGEEVKSLTLAAALPLKNAMWHGLAVTRHGFALRMHNSVNKPNQADRSQVRFFNNNGEFLSGNIDMADLTGIAGFSKGGRGPDTGFHGNGIDKIVFATVASAQPLVAVLKEDGALLWARAAADDLPAVHSLRADAAIDEQGRVCVVFDDNSTTGQPLIMARIFDADGAPLTGSFYVSERERPESALQASRHARVSWRGDRIVIAWESRNAPGHDLLTVAARFFQPPAPFRILQATAGENGGLSLRWTSAPLNSYAVESSSGFNGWTELQTGISGPGETLSWEDTAPAPSPGDKSFYRVRLLPHQPPEIRNGISNPQASRRK